MSKGMTRPAGALRRSAGSAVWRLRQAASSSATAWPASVGRGRSRGGWRRRCGRGRRARSTGARWASPRRRRCRGPAPAALRAGFGAQALEGEHGSSSAVRELRRRPPAARGCRRWRGGPWPCDLPACCPVRHAAAGRRDQAQAAEAERLARFFSARRRWPRWMGRRCRRAGRAEACRRWRLPGLLPLLAPARTQPPCCASTGCRARAAGRRAGRRRRAWRCRRW